MRRGIGAAMVVGAVLLAASCRDDGPRAGEARLELDGTAVVITADGERQSVDGDTTLHLGDTIAMEEGTAVLELGNGSAYELRSRDDVGTELVVGARPRLAAGDVLVAAGFPAQVEVDALTLTAQGALRVDADDATATAYGGRARVAGPADVDWLPALRRLVLVDGAALEPLSFDGTDPWDRRYLGEAIALGDQLEALARGYTSELAPGGRTVGFFQSVVPALASEPEFHADLLDPDRQPGETLVGAVIAVQGREGTFRDRWEAVFGFRDAGAAWGLVALDQEVSSAAVLETIEQAISSTTTTTTTMAGAPSSAPSGTGTSTSTTEPTGPSPTGPTTTTTTTTGAATATTTTTAPPPARGPLDPIIEPVDALLDRLLEVLL